jgi:hypothetical protein
MNRKEAGQGWQTPNALLRGVARMCDRLSAAIKNKERAGSHYRRGRSGKVGAVR